jgi:hypothetical protein
MSNNYTNAEIADMNFIQEKHDVFIKNDSLAIGTKE